MSAGARIVVALIRAYQRVISPLFPPTCRFHPTCSDYAAGAIRAHGGVRGLWLALRRIGRCHPWNAGGIDPVPSREPALLTQDRGL